MNDDFFTLFTTSSEDQRFILNNSQEKLVVYTQRSLQREAKNLQDKLAQLGPEKLIWVAPYHHEIVKQIEPNGKLVFITPASFTKVPEGLESIITNPTSLDYFTRAINSQDKFIIDFHPVLKRSFYFSKLQEFVATNMQQAAQRLKTINHFEKIWQYNWRRNQKTWQQTKSISQKNLKNVFKQPEAFILGGFSASRWILANKEKKPLVWCADTAVTPLIHAGIIPELVFSVDSGHGSYEHFDFSLIQENKISIVLDALSFHQLYQCRFKNIYSYANSNPLLTEVEHHFDYLENQNGDVFGLMKACHNKLFERKELPEVVGHDGKNANGISHLRGSGYYRYQYAKSWRLANTETYLHRLNSRF